ncbi:L-seryl-tRNA(Sec) kinase [Drosophila eugracilis]|uniref:L-seryl-tRNA(Sec) kinase n=1 Tax=Drosophila eugracilis TaxID=29029 RepID=UPI0007E6CF07|nr:L-seryl-tRNA(Sec) kinase [Drosophila eugracilis]
MLRICLVALIGLPGAGKTSLCTWLLSQTVSLNFRHIVHLCYDDFFDDGPLTKLPYKEQRWSILKIIEQLITAIQENTDWPPQIRRIASCSSQINGSHLILCDDNFYYRSMRYNIYQLCRSTGCIYGQIHIDSSLDSCIRGNSTRSGSSRVPASVIQQMKDRLEPPGSEAWERNSIKLQEINVDCTASTTLAFISSLTDMPAKLALSALPSALKTQPQDQSLVHSLDLLLRSRIGALLHGIPQEDKGVAGRTLNNRRKQILTRFRSEGGDKQGGSDGEALDYYVNLLN